MTRSSLADLGENHDRHPGRVNDTLPSATYVSRVLHLPVGIARSVFEGCRADRPHYDVDGVVLSFGADSAGPLDLVNPWLPICRCAGRLRFRRGPFGSAPVEVEILQWSREATQIGLRPDRNRRVPARYLDAASTVVEAMAAELELRGLLATHPAHATGADRVPKHAVTASAWL